MPEWILDAPSRLKPVPERRCALYYSSVNLNTERRAQFYEREPYFYFLAMGAEGTSSPWHSMQFIWAVMP